MVTIPGTATVATRTVPGKTLVVTVAGLGSQTTAKVKVTGPKKYKKTLRVRGRTRLTELRPGRYTLKAKAVGQKRAVDRVQRVRVKNSRGAKVRFVYKAQVKPDTTAPLPVSNIRVVRLTAHTIVLSWDLPEDLLEVTVERSGGTDADPLDFVLNDAGDGLVDTGLTAGKEYTYRVATIDDAGNTSSWKSITVSTLAE